MVNFYFSGTSYRMLKGTERKIEHHPRWVKGFCIIFYEESEHVLSCTWDGCIVIGWSMALLFSLVVCMGAKLTRAGLWKLHYVSICLSKTTFPRNLYFVCFQLRLATVKFCLRSGKQKWNTSHVSLLKRRCLSGALLWIIHFFVYLLLPLGNGCSQAHSFSYQSHKPPGSLISGPGLMAILKQEFISPACHAWKQIFRLEKR